MEIKAILEAPYTEEQKVEFIVEQNHNLGYEIRGTQPDTLTAWSYTQEEIEEQKKQQRNQEIDNKIKELNEMSIPEIINGNTKNIEVYKQVINSLKETKN